MQFENTIVLPASPTEAYSAVTDLAVLAECLPGARLQALDPSGRSTGMMTVRVGAMVAQFEGQAWVAGQDEEARTVEVVAEGAGAQGRATATVRGRVVEDPAGSRVDLSVDVDISGTLARLGQGMAMPVVERLVDRFGENLAAQLQSASAGAVPARRAPVTDEQPAPAGRPVGGTADDVLDVGAMMPFPLPTSRPVVALLGVVLGMVLGRLLRRRPPAPTVVINSCGRHGPMPSD